MIRQFLAARPTFGWSTRKVVICISQKDDPLGKSGLAHIFQHRISLE